MHHHIIYINHVLPKENNLSLFEPMLAHLIDQRILFSQCVHHHFWHYNVETMGHKDLTHRKA
jgi:hypothetical protein